MFPSPNCHNQEVGVFVEVSLNCTYNGWVPVVWLAVKLADGMFDVILYIREYGEPSIPTTKYVLLNVVPIAYVFPSCVRVVIGSNVYPVVVLTL